jgi:hypothetical protein
MGDGWLIGLSAPANSGRWTIQLGLQIRRLIENCPDCGYYFFGGWVDEWFEGG